MSARSRSKESPSSPDVSPAQLVAQGPPSQEVRRAVADLAGAGAAQRKAEITVLDEPVNLVEQSGDFLNFVDDDLPGGVQVGRLQILAQKLGAGDVAAELVGLEQVEPDAVGVALPEQRALARLSRSPQKEGLGASMRERECSFKHLP